MAVVGQPSFWKLQKVVVNESQPDGTKARQQTHLARHQKVNDSICLASQVCHLVPGESKRHNLKTSCSGVK